jgi:hypothetical protein
MAPPYMSQKAAMLERLYDEDRPNTEYKRAMEKVLKDEAVASLPTDQKIEAIERAIYDTLCRNLET